MAKTKEILIHGQLTQVTEFDSTAQEIDDAVARVAKDLPEGGAAPAGYGLGENKGKTLTASDDLNAVNTIGAYRWGDDTSTPANTWDDAGNTDSYGVMEVVARSSTEFIQRARSFNSPANEVQRAISGSKVGEWEWVNPPMKLGVEYRTTERYLDKPVYARTLDCGALTANTTASLNFSNMPADHIVDYYGDVYHEGNDNVFAIPFETANHSCKVAPHIYHKTDANRIMVSITATFSTPYCHLVIKYTKKTD